MLNLTTNKIERNIAEDNIIKYIRNLCKKNKKDIDIEDIAIRDIRNPYKKKKKDKDTDERPLRDKRILFKSDEEDYYEPVKTGKTFSNNYIEYESN